MRVDERLRHTDGVLGRHEQFIIFFRKFFINYRGKFGEIYAMELGRIRVFVYFFYKKYFFAEQAYLWPKILREVLFLLFLLKQKIAKSS